MINLGTAFVKTADSMSQINSRLSLVTSSTAELATVQERLLKVSNDARVGLQGTSDLYSQLARSTSQLGLESSQLIDITKTISQSITISGASATSASAALFQLSQGFSAGALRGEELNSVMEQTPRLAQAIADGMGVSIGQLRALGAEGALTSEKVLIALQNQASAVNSEFSGIAINAEQGYTVLQNTIANTIADLDKQNDITKTIGQTFQTLGEVVSKEMTLAFDNLSESGMDFGEFVGESIVAVIIGAGELYDTLETVGDMFNIVGALARSAFYGIQVVSSTLTWHILQGFEEFGTGAMEIMEDVANGIQDGFEDAINVVIRMINMAISGMNSLGANIPQLSEQFYDPIVFDTQLSTGWEKVLEERVVPTRVLFEEAQTDLKEAWADLWSNDTDGRDAATRIAEEFESTFKRIRSEESGSPTATGGTIEPTDYDAIYQAELAKQDEYTKTMLENMDTTREVIDEVSEATEDFTDVIYNDNDSLYEAFNDTIDTTNDFSDSISDLDSGISTVIDTMDDFIFQFTDVLFNSLQSNADQLASIGKQTAFNTMNYSQALSLAVKAKNDLSLNPMDTNVGDIYTEAYNQFVSSATDYLDPSNFTSMEEYRFAQSTVGTQAGQFESTAQIASETLTSMNDFLEAINLANEDGSISDDEQIELQKLALKTQDSNNALLLIGLKNVAGTVDSQTYFDSDGAKSTDLRVGGENTVSKAISTLMGGKQSGIGINGLINMADGLGVDTGLGTSISTLSTATANQANDVSETASNTLTTANEISRIGSVPVGTTASYTQNTYKWQTVDALGNVSYGSGIIVPYNAKNVEVVGTEEKFKTWNGTGYYANGGFTTGIGEKDKTGFKQAGIVHEGEYVAPKWMVDSNPAMFNQLEMARQKGSFAQGGYTSQPSFNVNATMGNNGDLAEIRKDIKMLTMIINNVTEGGNLMNVALRG